MRNGVTHLVVPGRSGGRGQTWPPARSARRVPRLGCGGLIPGATWTTTTTSTTSTTSPTSTTTPPPGSTYNVVDTDLIVSGQERTLEANCRAGDRLVSYTYDVASPTGSNTS